MISIEKLCLTLGGQSILHDVAMNVASGETVALVGPNGSGKTSVLRTMLGLVPYEGVVTVGGFDAGRQGVAARGLMAYMPQRPAFGNAQVGEVTALLRRLRGIGASGIAPALERVGLAGRRKSLVRTLSLGMQQRLSLALLLIADAPLLVMDEPTASLDVEAQGTFEELVAEWRRQGRTLVVTSHRPEEVARFADRAVRLDQGRVADQVIAVPKPRRAAEARW